MIWRLQPHTDKQIAKRKKTAAILFIKISPYFKIIPEYVGIDAYIDPIRLTKRGDVGIAPYIIGRSNACHPERRANARSRRIHIPKIREWIPRLRSG
jgi:hypothetical protein